MGDSGTWAAFGKQALKIKKQAQSVITAVLCCNALPNRADTYKTVTMCRKARSDLTSEEQADSSKPEHQPAKVLHGEDNTDKTADQMQGEETPPQVFC